MHYDVATIEIFPKGIILRDDANMLLTVMQLNPATGKDWETLQEIRDYVVRTYATCRIIEPLTVEKGI